MTQKKIKGYVSVEQLRELYNKIALMSSGEALIESRLLEELIALADEVEECEHDWETILYGASVKHFKCKICDAWQ